MGLALVVSHGRSYECCLILFSLMNTGHAQSSGCGQAEGDQAHCARVEHWRGRPLLPPQPFLWGAPSILSMHVPHMLETVHELQSGCQDLLSGIPEEHWKGPEPTSARQ